MSKSKLAITSFVLSLLPIPIIGSIIFDYLRGNFEHMDMMGEQLH